MSEFAEMLRDFARETEDDLVELFGKGMQESKETVVARFREKGASEEFIAGFALGVDSSQEWLTMFIARSRVIVDDLAAPDPRESTG